MPRHKEVMAKDLSLGDKLENLVFDGGIEGNKDQNAFEWGFFAGDGYLDDDSINAVVCGNKVQLFNLGMKGKLGKMQAKKGYKDPVGRVYLNEILKDLDVAKELNDKSKGIPEYFFSLDKESTLNFIAGWLESDGTIQKNNDSWHYRIYGSRQKMLDLQLLLRRSGVNNATVSLASPKGFETNYGQRNYDLYYVTIPSFECQKIPTRLKKITAEFIASPKRKNNANTRYGEISSGLRQKVAGIELLENPEDTYCFTENLKHKGVFANVLTHQCNLVETFPTKHESLDDFLVTIKYAYLYAKTVTLLATNWTETNRAMLRNRRIGLSVTGVAQFIANHGVNELKQWFEKGFETAKKYDKIYSEWFAIPESIKITTAKPSGTLSILAGVTPGIHYPESKHYIRRVRISNTSPYIPVLQKAGLKIEPAFGQEQTTSVVEFLVSLGDNVRTLNEVSMWEQLSLASMVQRYWADNSVSVTVTFDPEKEGHQIEDALNYFQYQLKAVSFLPKLKEGAYPQMPYEEITKEEYDARASLISPLDFSGLFSEEALGEKYCSNEGCAI